MEFTENPLARTLPTEEKGVAEVVEEGVEEVKEVEKAVDLTG